MPNLLFCVGKAVADVGLAELVAVADGNPMTALGLIGKIGVGVWKQWSDDKKQDKLNADVLDAAKKSFEEAKQAAIEVAKQVTPDPVLQGHVERFVTLVPASIRASLRRPEDPTGTTVPANFAVQDADDLVKLLPARLPRFKAGDTPAFLRGWRLVEQIGAGGFGEVWKAQNTRAGNLVNAVKFGHGLSDAEQTLLNEGDVLNRILAEGHHDGIVKLLDVWADGDAVPWLRYEYIAGGDLTAQVHQWQRLPAEQRIDRVLDALTQIAGTVGHFHTLDPFIVHRDLKPSNILYDPTAKRFKVADFGIGGVSSRRMLSAEQSHSMTAGAVVASYLRGSHTPLYASPQQRAGSKLLDPRDDVHALGVIAYQMVTGQLEAAPGSDAEQEMGNAGAPPALIALVKNCTANRPERRPKNAADVVERLKALTLPTPLPPEPVVPATSPARGEVGAALYPPPATLASLTGTSTSPGLDRAGIVAERSGATPSGGGTEESSKPSPATRLRLWAGICLMTSLVGWCLLIVTLTPLTEATRKLEDADRDARFALAEWNYRNSAIPMGHDTFPYDEKTLGLQQQARQLRERVNMLGFFAYTSAAVAGISTFGSGVLYFGAIKSK